MWGAVLPIPIPTAPRTANLEQSVARDVAQNDRWDDRAAIYENRKPRCGTPLKTGEAEQPDRSTWRAAAARKTGGTATGPLLTAADPTPFPEWGWGWGKGVTRDRCPLHVWTQTSVLRHGGPLWLFCPAVGLGMTQVHARWERGGGQQWGGTRRVQSFGGWGRYVCGLVDGGRDQAAPPTNERARAAEYFSCCPIPPAPPPVVIPGWREHCVGGPVGAPHRNESGDRDRSRV